MSFDSDESFWVKQAIATAEVDMERLKERLAEAERVIEDCLGTPHNLYKSVCPRCAAMVYRAKYPRKDGD